MAHEGGRADGHTRGDHAVSLSRVAPASAQIRLRGPASDGVLERGHAPRRRHSSRRVGHVEHEFVACGGQPTDLVDSSHQRTQRQQHPRRSASNLDVIVDGRHEHVREVSMHPLESGLQRSSVAPRAERAALGAAAPREKAHPAVRPERGDVGRRAVSSKQEKEQHREAPRRIPEESNTRAHVERVPEVQLNRHPIRPRLQRQPHCQRHDLRPVGDAHAQLYRAEGSAEGATVAAAEKAGRHTT